MSRMKRSGGIDPGDFPSAGLEDPSAAPWDELATSREATIQDLRDERVRKSVFMGWFMGFMAGLDLYGVVFAESHRSLDSRQSVVVTSASATLSQGRTSGEWLETVTCSRTTPSAWRTKNA